MSETPLFEAEVPQRTIPVLPAEFEGQPITWRAWERAPQPLAHVDLECPQCAHPGPPSLAFGLVEEKRSTIRFHAIRCPSCQEMAVYHRPSYGGSHQIAYSAPRTVHA